MVDYVKLWIRNRADILRILANHSIDFKFNVKGKTGEILEYPQTCTVSVWEFKLLSPNFLQITGSLHKYWNDGTNWNDFKIENLLTAIIKLCNWLQVNPNNITIHNLEFGVNITPEINATEILKQVICYRNIRAKEEINNKKYFTEYILGKYILKFYDKGKQARNEWGLNVGNVLRVEVKAMDSSYFSFCNIKNLADLLDTNNHKLLGCKINKVFENVVFDDPTLRVSDMTKSERKVYEKYKNPRVWIANKKNRNSTIVAQENRFRAIVAKYGKWKLHSTIAQMIKDKWSELSTPTTDTISAINDYLIHCKLCGIYYLEYNPKINKVTTEKKCISCGSDISQQDKKSKYCSAKYVGEQQAHKCRNTNSNPRNNYTRQLQKIHNKGQLLFDITPYLKKVG